MSSLGIRRSTVLLFMLTGVYPGLGSASNAVFDQQSDITSEQQDALEELRDPTRPADFSAVAVTVKETHKKLQLSSILSSDGRRVAMINNRPMLEGSTYDGISVSRIRRDTVDISYENGTTDTLTLQDKRVTKDFK